MFEDKRWSIFTAAAGAVVITTLSVMNYLNTKKVTRVQLELLDKLEQKLNKKENDERSEEELLNPKERLGELDRPDKRAKMANFYDIRHKSENEGSMVHKFCVTGGPCAGKTTSIAACCEYFQDRGYKVFVVPEAATLLSKGGAMIVSGDFTEEDCIKFQISLMQLQIALEEVFVSIAHQSKSPSLVVCDRGLMDGSAYMSKEGWEALLDEEGWTTAQLRDQRYDAVVHLVTAADGATDFYNLMDNVARYESVEDATQVDQRLQQAWYGHPHFRIVDNRGKNFNEKVDECLEVITSHLFLPKPCETTRKFLLRKKTNNDYIPMWLNTEKFFVEETFLKNDFENLQEEKVRKRTQAGSSTYIYAFRTIFKGEIIEKKRHITGREYMRLLKRKHPDRLTLEKERHCFIWDVNRYTLDVLLNVPNGPCTLRIETTNKNVDLKLPDCFDIIREVTNLKDYTSYILSKKNWYIPPEDEEYLKLAIQRNPSYSELQAMAETKSNMSDHSRP